MILSNKNIIIGLGTGRCGSVSLASLLNLQKDFNITHEICPSSWEFCQISLDYLLSIFNNKKENIIGDCAYYHINYSEKILELLPNTKFPIMIRDKEETINSYMKKTQQRNHWSTQRSREEKEDYYWDRTYPKYNLPKREAVTRYYNEYYEKCRNLVSKYPDKFKIFGMKETFNSLSGQSQLLEFLNINANDRIFNIGVKRNES